MVGVVQRAHTRLHVPFQAVRLDLIAKHENQTHQRGISKTKNILELHSKVGIEARGLRGSANQKATLKAD